MRIADKNWNVGEITLRESRYESGLVEIGVYRPQQMGAIGTPTLVASIARQSGKGMKWVVASRARNRAFLSRVKGDAIAFAVGLAEAELAEIKARFPVPIA